MRNESRREIGRNNTEGMKYRMTKNERGVDDEKKTVLSTGRCVE